MKYKIIRFYQDENNPNHLKIIKTGLSLKEAQAHCKNPKTKEAGVWFDGYEEEK